MNGKTPSEIGIPNWRAQVSYVNQSRVSLNGTPAELYFSAQKFASQKGRRRGDLPAIVFQLGLEQAVLNRRWVELSVKPSFNALVCNFKSILQNGQAQRVAVAIAVALNPVVLLLDEPTSQCDPQSARRVEEVIKRSDSAIIWATNSFEQANRLGGRVLELPQGFHSSPTVTVETARSDLDPDLSHLSRI